VHWPIKEAPVVIEIFIDREKRIALASVPHMQDSYLVSHDFIIEHIVIHHQASDTGYWQWPFSTRHRVGRKKTRGIAKTARKGEVRPGTLSL
jgi:hypothetical protein